MKKDTLTLLELAHKEIKIKKGDDVYHHHGYILHDGIRQQFFNKVKKGFDNRYFDSLVKKAREASMLDRDSYGFGGETEMLINIMDGYEIDDCNQISIENAPMEIAGKSVRSIVDGISSNYDAAKAAFEISAYFLEVREFRIHRNLEHLLSLGAEFDLHEAMKVAREIIIHNRHLDFIDAWDLISLAKGFSEKGRLAILEFYKKFHNGFVSLNMKEVLEDVFSYAKRNNGTEIIIGCKDSVDGGMKFFNIEKDMLNF